MKEIKMGKKAEAEKQAGKAVNGRRDFLKKAVYTTPKLVALGYLARPENSKADFSGGPDGPPGGWNP